MDNTTGQDIMRTGPIKDDPWGNVAHNPSRMRAHLRKLNHDHIVMNRKMTAAEEAVTYAKGEIVELKETIKLLVTEICDKDEELTIAAGKIAELNMKAKKKKKPTN